MAVRISGKPLTCLVCGHQSFEQQNSMLNTRSGELFNIAWLDNVATNYICTECGYIFWFWKG